MLSQGPLAAGPTSSNQFQAAAFREYPYLIQQGVKLKTDVRFRITGPITGGGAMVRGRRGGSDYFDEASLTLLSGSSDVYLKTDYEANTAFPSGTAFHNPFTIDWQVSRDGGTSWEDAGASSNPIYVCLADPNASPQDGIAMFRTVVHLACSSDPGATDPDSAVAKTWAFFSGRAVKTWDGKPLYYYLFGYTIHATPQTVKLLLTPDTITGSRTGNCTAFTRLLGDAWGVNGIESEEMYVKPNAIPGFNFMFVKAWGSLVLLC